MNKFKKRVKGITLIALVVTIIVLLIIAGIAINLSIGNEGLFNRAEKSTNEYNKQEAKEKVNLKITSAQIKVYAESQRIPTLQEVADDFCEDDEVQYVTLKRKKTAKLDKITVGKAKAIFTKLKEYPYEFEIDSSLKLASIDGIKIAETDNSNDDLMAKIEEMQASITSLQSRVKTLEDETIVNKRIKLLDEAKILRTSGTNNYVTNNINISLNDEITNYKYLEIQLDAHRKIKTETTTDGSLFENTVFIATEQLSYHNSDTVAWDNGSSFILNVSMDGANLGSSAVAWFKDSKTLYIGNTLSNKDDWDQIRIKNIYGIK